MVVNRTISIAIKVGSIASFLSINAKVMNIPDFATWLQEGSVNFASGKQLNDIWHTTITKNTSTRRTLGTN